LGGAIHVDPANCKMARPLMKIQGGRPVALNAPCLGANTIEQKDRKKDKISILTGKTCAPRLSSFSSQVPILLLSAVSEI